MTKFFRDMTQHLLLLPWWLRRSGYYALALLFVAAAAALRWVLPETLGPTPFLAFYLAWVGAAAFGGLGPGLLATAASWVCIDLLFDPAGRVVNFPDPTTIGRLIVLAAGGLTVSLVAEALRRGRIRQRRQAQELMRLTQLTDLGPFLIRDEQDRILRWSDGCARLYGFTAEQAVGRISHELLRTEFPQPLETIQAILREKGQWEGELSHHRADGTTIHVASLWVLPNDDASHSVLEVNNDMTDRKRAQDRLRQSEAQLRTIVENLTEGLVVSTLDGRLFHWNRAALKMHGFTSLDECQRRLPEFADVFELSTIDGAVLSVEQWPLTRILRGEDLHDWEVRIRRVHGDWQRIFSYGGSLVRTEDGRQLLAVVTVNDITQRKEAEEAMREAHEQLQQQAEELQTQAEELQAQAEELTTANEELRDSEQALREREEQLRQRVEEVERLMEVAPVAIWVSHDPQCNQIVGNRTANSFYEAYGLENVSANNSPVRRFYRDGKELRAEELPMQEAAAKNIDVCNAELDVLLPSGKWLNMLGSASPLLDVDGRVRGCVGAFVDITGRRQAEQALRDLNATLESKVIQRTAELEHRARQLQELTLELSRAEDQERRRLAEILHDDLQQVLAAAKFHLGLLNNRVKHDPSLHAIAVQVDHMLKDAIEKSRSLSHELSPAVLHHDDFTETLEWLAHQVQAKHGLLVHVAGFGQVKSQSDALKAFLYKTTQEMLFNVVKHARVNEARVRVRRLGRYICLSVSDHGRGLDLEQLRRTPGFGLLSIRERVELLGGRMKIKSARDRGSTFIVVVPDGELSAAETTIRETAEVPSRTGPAPERQERSPLRVLLADDHAIVREGLISLLSDEGTIEVVGEAANGREAIDLAARLRPDVVIIDVSMPLINGDEATRQIKQHLPMTRVVALSMFAEPKTIERMHAAGADAYVLKTAPSEELLAAIHGRRANTTA